MTQEEHIWLYNLAQLTHAMAACWDEVSLKWAFADASHAMGQDYVFDLRPYWAKVSSGVALTPADIAVVAAAAGKGASEAVAGLSFDLKLEGSADQPA